MPIVGCWTLIVAGPVFGEQVTRSSRAEEAKRRRSERPSLTCGAAETQVSTRLTAPAQGGQDVLGAAVLAFRKPLAQLAEDRTRHPVALQPAKHLLFAGGEL